jgi:hypothetical protein
MALAHKPLVDALTNEIRLSLWQSDFVFSEARYRVACCGRRSGKTIAACTIIYLQSLKANQVIWAVATTFGQAKKLYFLELQKIIPRVIIKSINKSELRIELINGSVIELKGSNNEDALLGDSLDLLVMDEYQSVDPVVLEKLTPMLADRKGKLVVVGTPRGYNHFYEVWLRGQQPGLMGNKDFFSMQVKTIDAETIDDEEIEEARMRMSKSMFAQEFEASFESVAGLVYKEFDITLNGTDGVIQPKERILIGMDFNVGKMCAIVGVKRLGQLHLLEEIVLTDSNTKEMCLEIQRRYRGHPITIFPDPAGSARSTTGNTNFQIISEHGLSIDAFKSHPKIRDRVNCVNALICNAKDERRLYVNASKCPEMIKTFKGQVYNGKGDPEKDTGLDHQGDSVGYLIARLFPIAQQLGSYSLY